MPSPFFNLAAGATADRRAAEANGAAAARFAACFQAFAALLQHVAAGLVARGAGDAHTFFGVFAFARAAAQVALANSHAVPGAAAVAHSIGHHLAEILQRGTAQAVFALAIQLEAPCAFLKLQLATRHHTVVGTRHTRRHRRGLRKPRLRGDGSNRGPFHQYSTRHGAHSLLASDGQP